MTCVNKGESGNGAKRRQHNKDRKTTGNILVAVWKRGKSDLFPWPMTEKSVVLSAFPCLDTPTEWHYHFGCIELLD